MEFDPIVLNDTHLLNKFSETQLHALFKKREIIKRDLSVRRKNNEIGFLLLPYQKNLLSLQTKADEVKNRSKYFLVIGIGGSSLGAKAAIHALTSPTNSKIFFLENPNPDTLARLISEIDLSQTSVNVISKSGTTLETLSQFFIIFEKMKKVLSLSELKKRIIITTEPGHNFLSDLADDFAWSKFSIPSNVGGRFSVLSPVGLFPMAVAGIDIQQILAGAQWIDQNSREAYHYGTLSYAVHQILQKPLTVLFPYDERLSIFSDWFCQLWGESLAKSENSGPTPLKAIGSIDQHSLLQLFLEGPRNKWYTTIGIQNYDHALTISNSKILGEYAFLKNKSLHKILEVQRQATERSLIYHQNPLCKLMVPNLSPYTLGALFYFFELATVVAGYFYELNPFNQPAVDEGKKWARELLQQ